MNSADLYTTISELGSKKSQTSDTEIPRANIITYNLKAISYGLFKMFIRYGSYDLANFDFSQAILFCSWSLTFKCYD